MANEIWHSFDEAYTLYALIWRQTDDKVYDAVAGSDTFDTYTDADIDDYDVALANHADSDYHSVDFPSDISAGVYRVQIMHQVGGAIDADADVSVGQGEIYWGGSAEINPPSLDTLLDSILEDTGITIPAAMAVVDGIVDDILVHTGTTLPATLATAQDDLDILTGSDGAELSTDAITAVWAKAMSDLSAGAPSATASVLTAINWLYEAWRNKVTTNKTNKKIKVFKNDGVTVLTESDTTDDGTTFTKGEFAEEA